MELYLNIKWYVQWEIAHCEKVFPIHCWKIIWDMRNYYIEEIWNCARNLPKEIFLPQWRNFLWVLFTWFLLEFWLFSSHVMVLAAQMCFYNQISQTVWFYVSPWAFKIRTGIIASFNPCRQSEYGDKVISTICVFQNTHRECFHTSFVLGDPLRSNFFLSAPTRFISRFIYTLLPANSISRFCAIV